MANINKEKLRNYLDTAKLPATSNTLAREAREHGADEEIVIALAALPGKEYGSSEEVLDAVRDYETEHQSGVWRTQGSNIPEKAEGEQPTPYEGTGNTTTT
jgi:hypothetical protein